MYEAWKKRQLSATPSKGEYQKEPGSRMDQGELGNRTRSVTRFLPHVSYHLEDHLISCFGGSFQTGHPQNPHTLTMFALDTSAMPPAGSRNRHQIFHFKPWCVLPLSSHGSVCAVRIACKKGNLIRSHQIVDHSLC